MEIFFYGKLNRRRKIIQEIFFCNYVKIIMKAMEMLLFLVILV